MRLPKWALVIASCTALALALVGCGDSTPTGSNRPPVKPTAPFITMASVRIGGKTQTILTTATGLTLYYNTGDTTKAAGCAGQCAAWRPLMFAGPGAPIAPSALPGILSLSPSKDGSQIEYNGHPLYTYVNDTAPGQVEGQGLLGKWYVATPNLQRNA